MVFTQWKSIFSKEFIEANRRREGVVVGFDDYYVWKKHGLF